MRHINFTFFGLYKEWEWEREKVIKWSGFIKKSRREAKTFHPVWWHQCDIRCWNEPLSLSISFFFPVFLLLEKTFSQNVYLMKAFLLSRYKIRHDKEQLTSVSCDKHVLHGIFLNRSCNYYDWLSALQQLPFNLPKIHFALYRHVHRKTHQDSTFLN